MTIEVRDDLAYIVLKKIKESGDNQQPHDVNLTREDLADRQVTEKDLLGNIDYLNQKNYITAEFTGEPQGGVEPLPETIHLKKAALTDKGRQMLEKMEAKPPESLKQGKKAPIPIDQMPFLEKVMVKGKLYDIFDARDITVIVYRVMRDMMSTEASDRVGEELHKEALPTDDKSLQMEIAELWKDTNPLVAFLSRIRPPLEIKDERFLFRVANEGSMPKYTEPERVVKAVFSATKEELSQERIAEIGETLPGKIKQLWNQA